MSENNVTRISVLGSTGSVGEQALDVAAKFGYEVCALSVKDSLDFFENIQFNDTEWAIAREIIKEIKKKPTTIHEWNSLGTSTSSRA